MNFEAFNLSKGILSQVKAQGYKLPTPIQQQAIPVVLEGRDVMGLAQTGTGKTAAFVLPILERLLSGRQGQLRALIIAPTRELADQINSTVVNFARHTGLRSTVVYGGVSVHNQTVAIRKGVDIVVACPGRLLDHLKQQNISLSKIEMLVLDEADHMFDMGFLPVIRQILRYIPSTRQTLLFSATMPADIERLARDILRDPHQIRISNTEPVDTVSHVLFPVEQHLKTSLLLEILKSTDTRSVLIFTKTKYRAKSLGEKLQRQGFRAVSLQGNLSQNKRQAALDGFRKGSFNIMVATDIAARGIDISLISHVFNYDIPDTAEAYTHRTGRTGRAARTGEAYTFVTNSEKGIIYTIERNIGVELKCRVIDGFDYNAKPQEDNRQRLKPTRRPRAKKPAAVRRAG